MSARLGTVATLAAKLPPGRWALGVEVVGQSGALARLFVGAQATSSLSATGQCWMLAISRAEILLSDLVESSCILFLSPTSYRLRMASLAYNGGFDFPLRLTDATDETEGLGVTAFEVAVEPATVATARANATAFAESQAQTAMADALARGDFAAAVQGLGHVGAVLNAVATQVDSMRFRLGGKGRMEDHNSGSDAEPAHAPGSDAENRREKAPTCGKWWREPGGTLALLPVA